MTVAATIVFVHGAWEDSTIWRSTIAALEATGHRAVALDLPGRAGDQTQPREITLQHLRDAVVARLNEEPHPVVLVGHSFGGITISLVAEAVPEKVHRLIYVAAYLPLDGQSLQDLAFADADSKAGPNFQVDEGRFVARIKHEARADLFLNDADASLREGFADTMVDEPLAPLGTPVQLTPDRFGRVPKAYIRTARDQVVSPALQDRMIAATSVDRVIPLDTGHAPFLTNPAALAAAVLALAAD